MEPERIADHDNQPIFGLAILVAIGLDGKIFDLRKFCIDLYQPDFRIIVFGRGLALPFPFRPWFISTAIDSTGRISARL